jgi:hypothetical protein
MLEFVSSSGLSCCETADFLVMELLSGAEAQLHQVASKSFPTHCSCGQMMAIVLYTPRNNLATRSWGTRNMTMREPVQNPEKLIDLG